MLLLLWTILLLFVLSTTGSNAAATLVRIATFNASLNRNEAGGLITDLSTPDDSQAKSVAQIIQLIRPDLLLLNEFDYDNQGSSSSSLAAELFQQNYLGVSQAADADSIVYPYVYAVPSNTGIPSNVDLDNNNSTADANDAFGFGFFPGQYAFCVFSMYPIMEESIRTFQTFKWVDMPDALLPVNPDGSSYYSTEALDVFRLSSKNHADVPINAQNKTIHFLVSHPTPPVFDGEEDRNGRRNYDEIRFWKDYVNGASYMYDDDGVMGGLSADSLFVVAGDLNSDPFDGDSVPGAAQLLLEDPLIDTSLTPSSNGGIAAAESQAGDNLNHQGNPAFDTADFGFNGVGEPDIAPGNLRADYVLPSNNNMMELMDAGIFWPAPDEEYYPLAEFPTSDHRLVWIDVNLDGGDGTNETVTEPPTTSAANGVFGFKLMLALVVVSAYLSM